MKIITVGAASPRKVLEINKLFFLELEKIKTYSEDYKKNWFFHHGAHDILQGRSWVTVLGVTLTVRKYIKCLEEKEL